MNRKKLFTKEEKMCGIFGIAAFESKEELISSMYLGLSEVQHRGQDSTGIAYSDGKKVRVEKGMGLVSTVFTSDLLKKIKADQPKILIGHVRYSTSGESSPVNAQPHWLDTLGGRWALCSNGDVPGLAEQKQSLENKGVDFYTSNDAEFLLKKIYLLTQEKGSLREGIAEMMKSTCATYSATLLTKDKVYLFRDPWGNRPFVWGEKDNDIFFASETCGLKGLGIDQYKEIEPGEIVTIESSGKIEHTQVINLSEKAHCIFELIYFSRPSSIVFERDVRSFRYLLGKQLALEYPAEADFVTPVPDSGVSAASGFKDISGLPYEILLERNRYTPRTFMMPKQAQREALARLKYAVLESVLKENKRLVLIDDSIVRATTNREVIKTIRKAGAKEIHLRISCPPIIGPCCYGISTPTHQELIANRIVKEGKPDILGIARYLGVDSLGYLSLEGLKEVIRKIGQDPKNFCLACFTQEYKIR